MSADETRIEGHLVVWLLEKWSRLGGQQVTVFEN